MSDDEREQYERAQVLLKGDAVSDKAVDLLEQLVAKGELFFFFPSSFFFA